MTILVFVEANMGSNDAIFSGNVSNEHLDSKYHPCNDYTFCSDLRVLSWNSKLSSFEYKRFRNTFFVCLIQMLLLTAKYIRRGLFKQMNAGSS